MGIDRRFLDCGLCIQGIANQPSVTPIAGTQYIVGTEPAGDFLGASPNSIARYDGSAWQFATPTTAQMEVINLETGQMLAWNGADWAVLGSVLGNDSDTPTLAEGLGLYIDDDGDLAQDAMNTTAEDVAIAALVAEHNAILGTTNHGVFTEAHSAAIQAGIFDDFYPGDSFTINGRVYLILELDPYYNNGTDKHHLMLMPEDILYKQRMGPDVHNYGGYAGSEMLESGLGSAKATIEGDFGGEHILTYLKTLSTEVNTSADVIGCGTAFCDVDLLTEFQVFGVTSRSRDIQLAALAAYYDNCHQLALFQLDSSKRKAKYDGSTEYWWLRDVYNSWGFCMVNTSGSTSGDTQKYQYGVRPGFLVS